MPFSEAQKLEVKKKADFRCCLCKGLVHDVHHIQPESKGGVDALDNAAPLCAGCHRTYGNNPDFQKTIRQARDHWYETCESTRKALPLGEKTIFEKVDEVHREMRSGIADIKEMKSLLIDFYRKQLNELEAAATIDGLSATTSAISAGASFGAVEYVKCPRCGGAMYTIGNSPYRCDWCDGPNPG